MHQFENIFGLFTVAFTLVAVVAVFAVMLFSRSEPGKAPEYYRLGQEWTFGPLLVSAVDVEPVGPSLHSDYKDSSEFIGGSAHGTW